MTAEVVPVESASLQHKTGHSHLRGFLGLTAAELRRWFPIRAFVLAVGGSGLVLGIYAIWASVPASQDNPRLATLLYPLMAVWTALLVLVMVAATQGATANEIEEGTASWVLAKPVARPAFVLSKIAAAVPGVVLGAVLIPGMVARAVLVQAEQKGDTEFTAGQILELTGGTKWDRDEFTTLPPLSRHLGTLALISAVLLLVVAVMILLGTVVQARGAIFLAGLAVPIGLLIYGILGQEQIVEVTPAWAFDSLRQAVADNPAPVLAPIVVTALWIVLVLGASIAWFSRREL